MRGARGRDILSVSESAILMITEREFMEKSLKVPPGLGLHARVATMMAKAMQNYSCRVTLSKDDVEVDARSVLGLLLLAASPGTELVIRAQGPDSRQAIEEIIGLIEHDNSTGN